MVAACLVLAAPALPSGQTIDAVTHQHLQLELHKDPDSGPAVLGQAVPAPVGFEPAHQTPSFRQTCQASGRHRKGGSYTGILLRLPREAQNGVWHLQRLITERPPAGFEVLHNTLRSSSSCP